MGNIAHLTGANHERRISEPVSVGSRILCSSHSTDTARCLIMYSPGSAMDRTEARISLNARVKLVGPVLILMYAVENFTLREFS